MNNNIIIMPKIRNLNRRHGSIRQEIRYPQTMTGGIRLWRNNI